MDARNERDERLRAEELRERNRELERERDFELDAAPGRDAYPADREVDLERREEPVDGEAVGGVSGLAAGAAIGAATGGPVGAIIGAAAGALTGVGVAKGVDVAVNPDDEDAYWREHHATRPYATADRSYNDYRPAYRYGWESRVAPRRSPVRGGGAGAGHRLGSLPRANPR